MTTTAANQLNLDLELAGLNVANIWLSKAGTIHAERCSTSRGNYRVEVDTWEALEHLTRLPRCSKCLGPDPRLPLEPLVRTIGHTGGVALLADMLGVTSRSVNRWNRSGMPIRSAEDAAAAVNLSPWSIWVDEYADAVAAAEQAKMSRRDATIGSSTTTAGVAQ